LIVLWDKHRIGIFLLVNYEQQFQKDHPPRGGCQQPGKFLKIFNWKRIQQNE